MVFKPFKSFKEVPKIATKTSCVSEFGHGYPSKQCLFGEVLLEGNVSGFITDKRTSPEQPNN